MRKLKADSIIEVVANLCKEANYFLGQDVLAALRQARRAEASPLGQEVLDQILENARLAAEGKLPLCQDCGLPVLFLEVGQELVIEGDLAGALEEGIRRGYREGFLRPSTVRHPFTSRVNTGDGTPPVVHWEVVPGDRLGITFLPKGAGSENSSRLAMLKPFQGKEGIADFVARVVEEVGAQACPPLIVGVGIGGTAEKAMILAKKSLLRPVGEPSPDPEVAELERELLEKVNSLGLGPQGFGGTMTALAVHAESFPTHIASLPVAINLLCHSARHKYAQL